MEKNNPGKKYITFFLGFILLSSVLKAQFNQYDLKGGVSIKGLLPQTEFDDSRLRFSYLVKGFLRFEISPEFEAEASAGYGEIRGIGYLRNLYKTRIIPLEFRLILSPFNWSKTNPYGYAGLGALYYKVYDKPAAPSPSPVNDEGWGVNIPFGLGIEIKLSNSVLLDFSGGYNYTFIDDLNFYNNQASVNAASKANDGFFDFGIGITFVSGTGKSDPDMDGLTNEEESEVGTNPENPDSDADGLSDGDEVHKYKSNPLAVDTDNDGLSDYEEAINYKTKPFNADSDGDGLSDKQEIIEYNTDPLLIDSDGDKISDSDEILTYHTNPLKEDTDMDGLKDGREINQTLTNPLIADSDKDLLTDGEEVNNYGTDPLSPDTDGGGVDDKTEIVRGTNPRNPNDDQVLDISETLILEGITFASGSAEIESSSEETLTKVLNTLIAYPDLHIEIRGHTDSDGTLAKNMTLSQRRADAVREWLIGNGIDPSRITAVGYGPNFPIAPNITPEGKRKNRRIEFVPLNR